MKKEKDNFLKESVLKIALPITLQSIFQASFSVVDQVMIGQLGSVSVAGIGLGSKFASLFSVVISAVATAAGIMIAQYIGGRNKKRIQQSLFANMGIALIIALLFTAVSVMAPETIMAAYSKEQVTVFAAARYLWILALGFVPMAISLFFSTMLRSSGLAKLPMYGSIVSISFNVVLDYLLIFGKAGLPEMGIEGAAWATTIARIVEALWISMCFLWALPKENWNWGIAGAACTKQDAREDCTMQDAGENCMMQDVAEDWGNREKEEPERQQTFFRVLVPILLPILLCEFLWSLGENIYAVIYGHMGTKECAAMTLINPVQSLVIGALSGLSAAAGIIIGKLIGEQAYDEAYRRSKQLMKYGFFGSAVLSVILLLCYPYYVEIFKVEEEVKVLTGYILIAYAFISPIKVQNMILGGGILRSGGQTKYLLMIDSIGTWCFGIPLGLLAAFVFHLPIYLVYFMLSLEEGVRLIISLVVFKRKKWIKALFA